MLSPGQAKTPDRYPNLDRVGFFERPYVPRDLAALAADGDLSTY